MRLRKRLVGTTAAQSAIEFMHIPDAARREWVQSRMEQLEKAAPVPDQRQILERLTQADLVEQVIQSRYLGTKRFSLEGVTVLIPFLDEILNRAAEHGAENGRDGHEPSRTLERDGEHVR